MLTINVLGYGLDAKKGRNVNFTTRQQMKKNVWGFSPSPLFAMYYEEKIPPSLAPLAFFLLRLREKDSTNSQ